MNPCRDRCLPVRRAEWLYVGSRGHAGLCGSSWVTKDEFYAGLATTQALPGPLFNFAAYLGKCLTGHVKCSGMFADRSYSIKHALACTKHGHCCPHVMMRCGY